MGLKGKDFVVVCSDMAASNSIIRMKSDEDKIVPIDSHKVFALSGRCLGTYAAAPRLNLQQ